MGYLLPILVEYGHTVSCKIDISPVVYRHPVGSHIGKHLPVRQRTVWLDVIFQDSVGLCLRYIQKFSVGCSDKTVGLVER